MSYARLIEYFERQRIEEKLIACAGRPDSVHVQGGAGGAAAAAAGDEQAAGAADGCGAAAAAQGAVDSTPAGHAHPYGKPGEHFCYSSVCGKSYLS